MFFPPRTHASFFSAVICLTWASVSAGSSDSRVAECKAEDKQKRAGPLSVAPPDDIVQLLQASAALDVRRLDYRQGPGTAHSKEQYPESYGAGAPQTPEERMAREGLDSAGDDYVHDSADNLLNRFEEKRPNKHVDSPSRAEPDPTGKWHTHGYRQTVANMESIAYHASLTELGSSSVSGEVTIFTTAVGWLGVGHAFGLETSLSDSVNCTAKNGCGVHVHSGNSCEDSASQGGHYHTHATDPWSAVRYSHTDSQGRASFTFSVTDDNTAIGGKPFIVHNNAGKRVACGLLSEIKGHLRKASLAPLSGSGVLGTVVMHAVNGTITGAGTASGLEASLLDFKHGGHDCKAKNACGVHVHSGSSCADASSQGGHYHSGKSDPWKQIRYSQTDSVGRGEFVFSLKTDATKIAGHPFIVHSNSGGRVACGILEAVP